MKYFDYIAKNPVNGKKMRGEITGDDKVSAEQSLKSRGITIIEIVPMKDFLNLRQMFYSISMKVKKKDIKDFFDQLSFMLSTNLQLHKALTTLRDFSVSKKQRIIARPIAEDVRKGLSLHNALDESGYFDYATVQQVKSGEESGNVPNSLKRIAQQYEREIEFMGKIKNAMTYPILITIVMIGVLWVLMTLVVPSLADTLSNLGGELPLITKIVIGVSGFMSKSTPFLIVIIIGGFVAFKVMMKQPHFKYRVDSIKLKIPLIGSLIIKLEMSRFCRNLSAMQKSGITLVRSLNINQAVIKNSFLKKSLEKATKMIEVSGMNLSTALSRTGDFPELMVQLIEVGVNAGQISDVLEKIAYQYEKDIDNSIKRITVLIEPIMIIIVGILAGTVVISLFLPMFSIIDNL